MALSPNCRSLMASTEDDCSSNRNVLRARICCKSRWKSFFSFSSSVSSCSFSLNTWKTKHGVETRQRERERARSPWRSSLFHSLLWLYRLPSHRSSRLLRLCSNRCRTSQPCSAWPQQRQLGQPCWPATWLFPRFSCQSLSSLHLEGG